MRSPEASWRVVKAAALLVLALAAGAADAGAQRAAREAELRELDARAASLTRELLETRERAAAVRLEIALEERDAARQEAASARAALAQREAAIAQRDAELGAARGRLANLEELNTSLAGTLEQAETRGRELAKVLHLVLTEQEMLDGWRRHVVLPASVAAPLPGRDGEGAAFVRAWLGERSHQRRMRELAVSLPVGVRGESLPPEPAVFPFADLLVPVLLASTPADRTQACAALEEWAATRPHDIEAATWLGFARLHAGRPVDAAEAFAAALERIEATRGEGSAEALALRGLVAGSLQAIDPESPDYPRAYERSLELLEPLRAGLTVDLVRQRAREGRREEADALAALLGTLPEDARRDPARRAKVAGLLGEWQVGRGEVAAGAATLSEAVGAAEAAWGPDDARTLDLRLALAMARRDAGDIEAAASGALAVVEGRRRCFGPAHPATASALNALALCRLDAGDYAAAAALLREALPILDQSYGPESGRTAAVAFNLGLALRLTGATEEGERVAAMAVATLARTLGADHPLLVAARRDAAARPEGGAEAAPGAAPSASLPRPPEPPNPARLFPTVPPAAPARTAQAVAPDPGLLDARLAAWRTALGEADAIYAEGAFPRAARRYEAIAREVRAELIVRDDERLRRLERVALYNAACCHARADRPASAWRLLEKAVDAGYADAAHMRRDGDLELLRSADAARFEALTARASGGSRGSR